MFRGISIRLLVATAVISTFPSLVIWVGHAQAVPLVSPVTTTVFDESGALIPNCEIVFRSDSRAIVSYTGSDGSVTLNLQGGRYSVTTTKAGFIKTKILDVQVPMSEALRVAMKVDQTPTDGPILDIGPTLTTSKLPSVIAPGPSRAQTPRPAKKSRSWQCLYLWKCSTP